MKRIKALQPFVGVWGNQSYVFTDGEEKDVPDGLAESVTRSGTLAVYVVAPVATPAIKIAPVAPLAAEPEPEAPEIDDLPAEAAPVKRGRKY